MSDLDFVIESNEGETLTVRDMGEGFVILSTVNHLGKVERLSIKLEQLEAAVERLRDRHVLGAFG